MNIEQITELAEAKVSSIMKATLVRLADGMQPSSDAIETMMKLTSEGLVTYANSEYALTPEGAKIAQDMINKTQKAQQVKNRNARVRHGAMTSLGLKRTRSGAYESKKIDEDKITPDMLDALTAIATGKTAKVTPKPGVIRNMLRMGLVDYGESEVILTGKGAGVLRKLRENTSDMVRQKFSMKVGNWYGKPSTLGIVSGGGSSAFILMLFQGEGMIQPVGKKGGYPALKQAEAAAKKLGAALLKGNASALKYEGSLKPLIGAVRTLLTAG